MYVFQVHKYISKEAKRAVPNILSNSARYTNLRLEIPSHTFSKLYVQIYSIQKCVYVQLSEVYFQVCDIVFVKNVLKLEAHENKLFGPTRIAQFYS